MPKILIIEDEVSIRRVLTKILLEESDTYIVDEAEDGKLGFEKIKKGPNWYYFFQKSKSFDTNRLRLILNTTQVVPSFSFMF